jgi:hypothetical protein
MGVKSKIYVVINYGFKVMTKKGPARVEQEGKKLCLVNSDYARRAWCKKKRGKWNPERKVWEFEGLKMSPEEFLAEYSEAEREQKEYKPKIDTSGHARDIMASRNIRNSFRFIWPFFAGMFSRFEGKPYYIEHDGVYFYVAENEEDKKRIEARYCLVGGTVYKDENGFVGIGPVPTYN